MVLANEVAGPLGGPRKVGRLLHHLRAACDRTIGTS